MRVPRLGNKACLSLGVLLAAVTCAPSFANASSYKQAFLTADQAGFAPNTDPNLINPWGISFSSTGPFWGSDNNSGLSTIYDGTGNRQSLSTSCARGWAHDTGTPRGQCLKRPAGLRCRKAGPHSPALFLLRGQN